MRGALVMYAALMSFVLFASFALVGIGFMLFAPDVFDDRGTPVVIGTFAFLLIYIGIRAYQRRS